MIDRAETKAILGPTFQRGWVSPSCPNGERLVCQSCGKQAMIGHDVVHTQSCEWAEQERTRREKDAGSSFSATT
jgi:hypothetical protein